MNLSAIAPAWVVMGIAILAATASDEVKWSESVVVSGFVSGSYSLDRSSPGQDVDHFGLDDALLAFRYNSGPVVAFFGLYHWPDAVPATTLLDGYVSWKTPRGLVFTAGKFQSLIGYESYFTVDNPTIGYANNELIAIAPLGYHSGLKLEHESGPWSASGGGGFRLSRSQLCPGRR